MTVIGLLLVLAGCGNPEFVTVIGTVTLDNKPLDQAAVIFEPEFGPIATATTDVEGRFELTTGRQEGAHPAHYRVSVSKVFMAGVEGPPPPGGHPKHEWFSPEKYSDIETSGLVADVEYGEDNDFHFELVSK